MKIESGISQGVYFLTETNDHGIPVKDISGYPPEKQQEFDIPKLSLEEFNVHLITKDNQPIFVAKFADIRHARKFVETLRAGTGVKEILIS